MNPKPSNAGITIPKLPYRGLIMSSRPNRDEHLIVSLCGSQVSVLCTHGQHTQIVHQLPALRLRQSPLPRRHRCATGVNLPEQFAIRRPSHQFLVGKVCRLLRQRACRRAIAVARFAVTCHAVLLVKLRRGTHSLRRYGDWIPQLPIGFRRPPGLSCVIAGSPGEPST